MSEIKKGTTFGVKVNDEIYEKVYQLIEASGLNNKEWFEKLIEFESVKAGATEFTEDLKALEIHTMKIYELMSHMIQRSVFVKDHAVKNVTDKLEQVQLTIGEYQEKVKIAEDKLEQAQASNKMLEQEKEELSKQLEQAISTNINSQLLIEQYKEKIDTLSGLVNDYKGYEIENRKLKEDFAVENEQLKSQVQELLYQTVDLKEEKEKIEQQMKSLQKAHKIEMDRLTEQKDNEKVRELLEVERDYQKKIMDEHEEYNDKIKELYDEINSIRKEYEKQLKQGSIDENKKNG